MNCLSIDFHLEKVPGYNKYMHVNCTVCFTDLDEASDILSYISLPKSMKHTVGEISNCHESILLTFAFIKWSFFNFFSQLGRLVVIAFFF
jgi:hypothetical protein